MVSFSIFNNHIFFHFAILLAIAFGRVALNGDTVTLEAEKMNVFQVGTMRATDPTLMVQFWGSTMSLLTACHIIEHIGWFCNPYVGIEYDWNVFSLIPDPTNTSRLVRVIVSTPTFDNGTIVYYTDNIAGVWFKNKGQGGWNDTLNDYSIDESGFWQVDYYYFVPGTAIINYTYSRNDDYFTTCVADKIAKFVPNYVLCNYIAFPACSVSDGMGGNFLASLGYATPADCVDFLDNLPPTLCPDAQSANTAQCRLLHDIIAGNQNIPGELGILAPEIHCPHGSPTSIPCSDACLTQCVDCDPNASCIRIVLEDPTDPLFIQRNYMCQCLNGFVGNGTYCEPLLCNKHGKCPATEGTYQCGISGNCECLASFVTAPTANLAVTSYCGCQFITDRVQELNGQLTCIPEGQCVAEKQHDCRAYQEEGQSKCVMKPGQCDPFGHCECNPGFHSGGQFPCICETNKTIVQSTMYEGKVCIYPGECTEPSHCRLLLGGHNYECDFNSSEDEFGHCA